MEGCFIEFSPLDDSHALRTIECVHYVAALKREDELDEAAMAEELRDEERAYFRVLTPEEVSEWNTFWFGGLNSEAQHLYASKVSRWKYERRIVN